MHVLIIKTSSMGDVLHTLPALTDAMNAIPGIHFDWVVEEGFTQIPSWHPAVDKVFYPGLASHEHHELAKQQMRGFGGVVTLWLKNDSKDAANSMIKSLQLFQMASSLGGVESLVNHCYSQSHSGVPHDIKTANGIKIGLLRLSIGVEDVEDIWADLDAALNSVV